MINEILNRIKDVSLSKKNGKFLADKSYGYDTVFFIAKFILSYAENGVFNKAQVHDNAISYIEDIFQLKKDTTVAANYISETLNLLEYGNIVEKINKVEYRIIDRNILNYISQAPEFSYIFLYLLTYMTYKNDEILDLYKSLTLTKSRKEKEVIVNKIHLKFVEKSVSIKKRETNWAKQLVKYSLIVLGFVNDENSVTRTLTILDKKISIDDISVNVAGTKTPIYLPKKNDYIKSFGNKYVYRELSSYILKNHIIESGEIIIIDSLANNLAKLKLDILKKLSPIDFTNDYEKEQYIEYTIRIRNQVIQRKFRNDLLNNNENVCPICNFQYRDFLIASHIKPYSKCENTYDAINYNNGLLLCPNHDKLFESAKYMTIDCRTGKIILREEIKDSVDFKELNDKYINRKYIECERQHYLQWHNEQYYR